MKIVCTSDRGESLTIQYAFPYYYVSCDGLMSYTADIVTAEPYIPGEVYQGSHNPKRNLVLTFAVRHRDYWRLRDRVYSVFSSKGAFTWHPNTGEPRSITYYTESIEWSDPNSQGFRSCTVSLICPYPFFKGQETTVKMSYWKKNIVLPFPMHSPFTVGERIAKQIITIENPQPVNVGIIATFKADGGAVGKPKLQNISTGESFELDMALPSGSNVVVRTVDGGKRAWVPDDPQAVNIWDYSENNWIQLHPGDNTFRYDADYGLDYLDVDIRYSQLYLGG